MIQKICQKFFTTSVNKASVYIVAGKRTPIGSLMGILKSVKGPQLMSTAIKAAIQQIKLNPKHVDEVICGNVLSAAIGQNPARVAAMDAKLPKKVVCTTVSKVCASGMKSVMYAAQGIKLQEADVVVCGGFDSMTNAPFYLLDYRKGVSFGTKQILDGASHDGLIDAFANVPMGQFAEKTAKDFKLTRKQLDDYTYLSYERAIQAQKKGIFDYEITPVKVDKTKEVKIDEEPGRYKKEKIPQLKPAFLKDGVLTAANSSKINDGACALIVMSEKKVKELNLKPLARIVSYGDGGNEPCDFCIAPKLSSDLALKRAGLTYKDMSYAEINEAFSCTALSNMQLMKLDPSKVNIHGGAVALGHPIGMSGARVILSLMNVLKIKKGRYGLASICNGGGGASSIIIENLQ